MYMYPFVYFQEVSWLFKPCTRLCVRARRTNFEALAIFYIVQSGLCQSWSEIQKTGFLATRLIVCTCTVMIQSFRTDWSGQTVQTQIRLLLEEQSDQGLHCLLFHSNIRRFGLFV